MTWFIIGLLTIFLIWTTILIRKQQIAVAGFELLLTKFIEINQSFYEGQKNIEKKDKEILDGLVKQTSELSILRKQSTQINTSTRMLSETIKSLKDQEQNTKAATDELTVSKDIANALSVVSNNIRLLDKIAVNLKQSVDDLKRRK